MLLLEECRAQPVFLSDAKQRGASRHTDWCQHYMGQRNTTSCVCMSSSLLLCSQQVQPDSPLWWWWWFVPNDFIGAGMHKVLVCLRCSCCCKRDMCRAPVTCSCPLPAGRVMK